MSEIKKRLIFLCRQGLFRKVSRSQQSDKPRCLERFHTPPLYPKNCHPVFCKSLEDCVKCKIYLSGCSWQGATTVTKIKQISLHIYIIYVEVLIWGFIEIHFFMLQLFYWAKVWLSCFLIFWYQISHILINCITFIAGSCFSNDHVSCLFSVFCPSIVILRTAIWECLWQNVVDVYTIFWYLSCNKKSPDNCELPPHHRVVAQSMMYIFEVSRVCLSCFKGSHSTACVDV